MGLNSKNIIDQIKKFNILPIALGMLVSFLFFSFPVDYSPQILETQEQIDEIEKSIGEKKLLEMELDEKYAPKYEEINLEIREVAKEFTALSNEKRELDEQLKIIKESDMDKTRDEKISAIAATNNSADILSAVARYDSDTNTLFINSPFYDNITAGTSVAHTDAQMDESINFYLDQVKKERVNCRIVIEAGEGPTLKVVKEFEQ